MTDQQTASPEAAAPETTVTTTPVEQTPAETTTAPADAAKPADKAETAEADAGTSVIPEDDNGDDPAAEGQPKKKGGGFQKKIDELTRKNYEERAAREAAERKLAELTKPKVLTDPGDMPGIESYQTVDEWQKAVKQWRDDSTAYAEQQTREKVKQELKQQDEEQKALQLQAQVHAREDRIRTKYADYDRVIDPIAPLLVENQTLRDYVTSNDQALEVAYHLGKHPEVLTEIAKMSPINAARELLKLEDKLKAPPPPKPVTNAPEPMKPVGERATVAKTAADLAQDDDATAYIKRMNQKLGRK